MLGGQAYPRQRAETEQTGQAYPSRQRAEKEPTSRVTPARGRGASEVTRGTKTAGTLAFLVRWVNYLCDCYLGWTPVTTETFFEDLSNGLVLCRIVERLVPGSDFSKGVNLKPVTKKSCINNLEKALMWTWRQGVASRSMCTADRFYQAPDPQQGMARQAVVKCMGEVFLALQMRMRDGRARMRETLHKMQDMLSKHGRPLSPQTLAGDVVALRQDFASGCRIKALLIASGQLETSDAPKLWEEEKCCANELHFRYNGNSLNETLHRVGCPVLLSAAEWRNPPAPCPDSLVFQIQVIWDFCSAGVSPGMNRPKEENMGHFAEFICDNFRSSEDAFWAICPNNVDRLPRASFTSAMKMLSYDGDVKFIWHALDHSSQPGWITLQQWQRVLLQGMSEVPGLRFNEFAEPHLLLRQDAPSAGAKTLKAATTSRRLEQFQQRTAEVGSFTDLMHEGIKATQPTTGLDAWLELTDSTTRRVWLQTSVLSPDAAAGGPPAAAEAPGGAGEGGGEEGKEEGKGAVLVLEIRERAGQDVTSGVFAKVEVAKVMAVEKMEPEGAAEGDEGTLSFVMAAQQGADLLGGADAVAAPSNQAPLEAVPGSLPTPALPPSIFHPGPNGSVLLLFSAGPAPALRRQAVKFFDELRILVYFTKSTK